jgi:endoglucanase
MDLARKEGIKIQEPVITGGRTDTATAHINHNGVPAINIAIPTRYMHSHTSVIHKSDCDDALKLLEAIIKNLNNEEFNKIVS